MNAIFSTIKGVLLSTIIIFNINAQPIKIKGSDTMLPMMQLQVEAFMKRNGADINVTGGGSGTGITALLDGSVDLAMSSRDLKLAEKLKFEEKKTGLKVLQIASDALSIIVHPDNPVSQLTREQLEGIFTGKINNWKEVGGPDMRIIVYTRESSSGTFEFMKEHVMGKKEFAKDAISTSATAQIVYAVGQNKGAIGYVGLAYVENIVKAVSVSYDGGQKYISPTFNNAFKGIYPITRPLYIMYASASETKVKPFVDFVLSIYGQKLVTHKGYIPLK
ncbi:MAG: PstS family phosphate ABC transporter substrate-binding protein [Bacteroidota bacterium]|nr:PstS family phosphate ABC transporter substrate-binding protein [Bacteroidota bacterium]